MELSANARAVLGEINEALSRFAATGQVWTIFVNKLPLTSEDRQVIHDVLGEGNIKINLENSAEPAEWRESNTAGVWYGVFYDHSGKPMLETIEIGAFPQVAAAQLEDVKLSVNVLQQSLDNLVK